MYTSYKSLELLNNEWLWGAGRVMTTNKDYSAWSAIIYMQTGATGFDRGFWRPTDACRATLCSSLNRVGKKQLPIIKNWLSLP